MAKTVFRHGEVAISDKKVFLEAPKSFPGLTPLTALPGEDEELDEVVEYAGPTADDLRREAEAFKLNWERERETMVAAAQAEAATIVKDAEAAAFQEVKRKSDQAQKVRREAEDEA
ncbi:MAG: flagellar assembly protein FliH, partial [Treponemataceae bacterium]